MIASFEHKQLRLFWEKGETAGLPAAFLPKIRRILLALEAATKPEDLALPGLGFHPLKGDRKGTYAVKVNANWRITFKFESQQMVGVNLEDYH